ncbi:hypothetical protein P171DRAFT_440272 [Karstenula rhodostoma CBS 690.94]|uniref:Transmembrane protein n=1 Tax=Karstenula rhodostoma CBS 690.94 TaxID=1392251 RepID=A0A9P4PTC4_9PLEO|nr:hypothetical protein P171DRAFT_440272 [Karstenula rhodostoma CBS 690.94]
MPRQGWSAKSRRQKADTAHRIRDDVQCLSNALESSRSFKSTTMRMIEEEETLLPGEKLEREQVQPFSVRRTIISILFAAYFVALHVALLISLLGHSSIYTAPTTRYTSIARKKCDERCACDKFHILHSIFRST